MTPWPRVRRDVIAAIRAAPLVAQGDFAKAALADPARSPAARNADLVVVGAR